MEHEKDIPLEEREKWNLDRERDADALKDYTKVERVINKKTDEDGDTEYLVKCKLPESGSVNTKLTPTQGRDFTTIRAPGKPVTWLAILRRMRSTATWIELQHYHNQISQNPILPPEGRFNAYRSNHPTSSTEHSESSRCTASISWLSIGAEETM